MNQKEMLMSAVNENAFKPFHVSASSDGKAGVVDSKVEGSGLGCMIGACAVVTAVWRVIPDPFSRALLRSMVMAALDGEFDTACIERDMQTKPTGVVDDASMASDLDSLMEFLTKGKP